MKQEAKHSERLDANQLMQAASNVLDFLALIDEFPGLYAGPLLRNAIRRYEVFWLPLAAQQGKESRLLAAPLDIAWVWHVHMLAPFSYEQDCLNIVSQVIDHTPMNRYQRQEGLQRARYVWKTTYPREPFEIDLTQHTPFVVPYQFKISHDLEKACFHQSKFYYQVSLPHYTDRKFLAKAVERYEHHLELKNQNSHISVVPYYDVDLIWRAHLQLPLNYKEVTTEMFGTMVQRDDSEASVGLGSTLHDSETSTRAVWEEANLEFDKPGAMYRGEPPPHTPPRPDWLYASLAQLQYVMSILKIDVLNQDVAKTFYVQILDPNGSLMFLQGMTQCVIDNDKKHTITVSLRQKTFFGEKTIGTSQPSLLPYLDSLYVGGPAPAQPFIIDVPFIGARCVVRLTFMLNPPAIEGYRFTIRQDFLFAKVDHPSMVLSFPQAMLTPSDFAKPFLPCEVATHTSLDVRGREAFKCRVVHSTAAVLSAVEIISLHNVAVASANTVMPAIFPGKGSVEDEKRCVSLNQKKGERAMLIRGRKDWGICIGKWQKGKLFKRSTGHVDIKFFSLNGTKSWCQVRKYKEGLYLIYIDSSNYVYIDLKRGIFVLPPVTQFIPELIALAFSVSILYLLCKPYTPSRSKELRSSPSAHKKAKGDKTTPMLLAAGYSSTSVPTNVYLGRKACGRFVGSGSYDLDLESGTDWSKKGQSVGAFDSQEASLFFKINGAVGLRRKLRKTSGGRGRSGFFSGSSGGGFGGRGGGGDGGGGGGGGDGGGGC